MDIEAPETVPRFKRRKIVHPRRVPQNALTSPVSSPNLVTTTPATAVSAPAPLNGETDDTAVALREALRHIRRPRDRIREATRRAEETKSQALVQLDVPKQDGYASKFVAQTGQVIDKDDKQMTEYIEARLAEQNHRLYGWPIPAHLMAVAAAIRLESELALANAEENHHNPSRAASGDKETLGVSDEKTQRLAAGMGKLQEVDLGSDAAMRNIEQMEAAWKKMGGQRVEEQPARKVRLGRNGRPRRGPKQRNSEDIRRDQMVEAFMRDAKLEYFEEEKCLDPDASEDANNDDAMVEKFRLEFLESAEARQQRKPAAAPGAVKGAKEAPKGPKLGGSRSARAAMRAQEEQAAKKKK